MQHTIHNMYTINTNGIILDCKFILFLHTALNIYLCYWFFFQILNGIFAPHPQKESCIILGDSIAGNKQMEIKLNSS